MLRAHQLFARAILVSLALAPAAASADAAHVPAKPNKAEKKSDKPAAKKPDKPAKKGDAPPPDVKPADEKAPDADASAAAPPPPPASGDVLDFCALSPRDTGGKTFVRKRLVLLSPANAASIEDDPALKKVAAGRVLRDVFAARFPLKRFYNVVSTIPGKRDWLSSTRLATAEMREWLASSDARGEATGDDPEREADFVSYSLGCADFVAIPAVTEHKVTHQQTKVKTKDGKEQPVDSMSIQITGKLAIFARDGDAFRQIALLDASVPSIADSLSDMAAMAAIAAGKAIPVPTAGLSVPGIPGVAGTVAKAAGIRLPSHISAIPGASCKLGLAKDGDAGLDGCDKEGQASGALVAAQIDERFGPECQKAFSPEVGVSPEDQVNAIVGCEVRSQAFHLARALRKASRGVDGWKLYDALAKGTPDDPEGPTIALGDEEGVAVGSGFEVLDDGKNRIAFFRVTHVGPGGAKGAAERSWLSLRSGEAPTGSRVEEYPQLGLAVVPFASVAMLTYDWGITNVANVVEYRLPKVVTGGGLTIGYDLSPLLGSVETYFRAGAAYMTGSGENVTASVIPIEATIEKGFYAGKMVTVYVAGGGTFTMVKVTTQATDAAPIGREFDAKVYGPVARAGLDFFLSPTISARVEGIARVPVTKASYEAADGLPIGDDWARREDHFATVGANAGLGITF